MEQEDEMGAIQWKVVQWVVEWDHLDAAVLATPGVIVKKKRMWISCSSPPHPHHHHYTKKKREARSRVEMEIHTMAEHFVE